MEQATASDILTMVREFYAGGHKSSNKSYNTSTDEMVGNLDMNSGSRAEIGWVALGFDDALLLKHAKRAENRLISRKKRTEVTTATGGMSYYQTGQVIYSSNNYAAGNCGEMACVASYLAISLFRADPNDVWVGRIGSPGDHVFCLVGPRPAGNSVEQMIGNSLVIDPWLNTSCTATEYEYRAISKFGKWHAQGKRISFNGSLGVGWYAPGGEYSDTFMTAPLSFALATS